MESSIPARLQRSRLVSCLAAEVFAQSLRMKKVFKQKKGGKTNALGNGEAFVLFWGGDVLEFGDAYAQESSNSFSETPSENEGEVGGLIACLFCKGN